MTLALNDSLRYLYYNQRRKEPIREPPPDPFAVFDSTMPGMGQPQQDVERYPYPVSTTQEVVNHGPATLPSSIPPASTSALSSSASDGSTQAGTTSSSTSSSPLSTFTSTTLSSTTSTTRATTLSIAQATAFTHRGPAQGETLSFLSQTFPVTYLPSSASVQPIPTNSTLPRPIHLSPTAIGLLLSLAASLTLAILIFALRSVQSQLRHRRRRQHEGTLDYGSSMEKGRWGDSDDGRTLNGSSPSTIFGGKERTGLTPQPSWMTFPDGGAAASPYPLGLLPPPVAIHRVPTLHGQRGLGIGFVNSSPTYEYGTYAQTLPNPTQSKQPYGQGFSPPTITVTTSSPPHSTNALQRPLQGIISTSSSGNSTCGSFNRVSVYDDPVNGAQLMRPPKLTVVNGDRYSGWSSWDDNVGLELGVKIDRSHAPPGKRSSRRPFQKRRASAPRSKLAPVPEATDSSDERSTKSGILHLHPHRSLRRRAPAHQSPSVKSSPRSLKGTSPRPGNGKQGQSLLYDLPQFDTLSPNLGPGSVVLRRDSIRSESDYGPSPITRSPVEVKRRSKRRSGRTTSRLGQKASPKPVVSPSLSDSLSATFAYVYAYGGSDEDEDEIIQFPLPRRVNRASKRASSGLKKGNDTAGGGSSSLHASVGTLMMTSYGDEGGLKEGISSPCMPNLNRRKRGDESFGVGLGLSVPKESRQLQRANVDYPYSTLRGGEGGGSSNANGQARYRDDVPAPGMPSLRQMRLMEEQPDYRSPTYSLYKDMMKSPVQRGEAMEHGPYTGRVEYL